MASNYRLGLYNELLETKEALAQERKINQQLREENKELKQTVAELKQTIQDLRIETVKSKSRILHLFYILRDYSMKYHPHVHSIVTVTK